MKLSSDLSSYLDFLRFTAALAVLLGHMDQDGVAMAWIPLTQFSHEAVIIFFVLSGFIIYYSTTARKATLASYSVARLARVYSVAIPAIIFCVAAAYFLSDVVVIDTRKLSNYSSYSFWSIASSILFLNESWNNTAKLTLNHPYWSLCYEVWFYCLFGAFMFAKGLLRLVLLLLFLLIAGPAIVILLPIWIAGAVLAARWDALPQWGPVFACLMFVGSLALIIFVNLSGLDKDVTFELKQMFPGMWRLGSSQRFLTDYLIGVALVVNIRAFSFLPSTFRRIFERYRGRMAGLAAFSFTLYLFHRPFTQVIGAFYPSEADAILYPAAIASGILCICWIISWATERRIIVWRNGFDLFVSFIVSLSSQLKSVLLK